MKKIIQIILFTILVVTLSSCGAEKNENNTQEKQNTKQEDISKKIQEETKGDIKEISQKVLDGTMTEEEAQKAMIDSLNESKTFKNQLEKSKYEMPRMLELMKANRDCLIDVDNKSDAKECEVEGKKLAKKLGVYNTMYEGFDDSEDEESDEEWNDEIKKEALKNMDEGIKEFEKMLPCLEKAKFITDMMNCGN